MARATNEAGTSSLMGFEYRFAPLKDLLILDRKLVKFLDQSLFGYVLVGTGLRKDSKMLL